MTVSSLGPRKFMPHTKRRRQVWLGWNWFQRVQRKPGKSSVTDVREEFQLKKKKV